MRRFPLLVALLAVSLAVMFVIATALDIELLVDPTPQLGNGGPGAALLGLALLVSDVFLPVPSNIVMVMNGSLFGVALGTALSLLGSVGASALAFGLGRRCAPLIARFIDLREREQVDAVFARWGGLAIALSRPLPIAAETIAALAGTTGLGWRQLLPMAALGSLPPALLYALAGAAILGVQSALVIFGCVAVLTWAAWLVGRRWLRGTTPPPGQ